MKNLEHYNIKTPECNFAYRCMTIDKECAIQLANKLDFKNDRGMGNHLIAHIDEVVRRNLLTYEDFNIMGKGFKASSPLRVLGYPKNTFNIDAKSFYSERGVYAIKDYLFNKNNFHEKNFEI